MAYHFNDNVYTKSFTPREYQVELLDAAKERNIIVCLGSSSGKIFIATKLLQELANAIRRPFRHGGKRTLYLVDSMAMVVQQAAYIRHLTDLTVGEYSCSDTVGFWDLDMWEHEFQDNQVLVMTSTICLSILQCGFLHMSDLNLIVLDDCHRAVRNHPMRQIMREFEQCWERPRILGLTSPLLNSSSDPGRLEGEIRRLETTLHSTAETASDIVSVLRYCTKPKELVVECGLSQPGSLDYTLEEMVAKALAFIDDHRYDPSEVYEEEFQEELRGIPDPKIDPVKIFQDFLHILHTLGPWCADRAALVLLIHLEKLKVKTPYERHFLLLCMVSSVMIKIRAVCDDIFQGYEEKERIYKFSTPKVLRLLEVLKQFKPVKLPEEREDLKLLKDKDLQKCSNETQLAENSTKNTNHEVNSASKVTMIERTFTNPQEMKDCIYKDNLAMKSTNSVDACVACIAKKNILVVTDIETNSKVAQNIYKNDNNLSEMQMEKVQVLHGQKTNQFELKENSVTIDKMVVGTVSNQVIECAPILNILNNDRTNEGSYRQGCETSLPIIESLRNGHIEEIISNGVILQDVSVTCLPVNIINKINKINGMSSLLNVKVGANNKINVPAESCICNGVSNENSAPQDICTTQASVNSVIEGEEAGVHHINCDSSESKSECSRIDAEALVKDDNRGGDEIRTRPTTPCRTYLGRGRGPKFSRKGHLRDDGSGRADAICRQNKSVQQDDMDALCGIVFVEQRFTAKILYHLLNDLRRHDEDFSFLTAQYTVDKVADPVTDPREAEIEHRKQEEVLKRFRMRECNLLVGTSVLEEGIDIPKCNLVVRFDVPAMYRSYVQSKGRARAQDAYFILMIEENKTCDFVQDMAQYYEIEQLLLRKCANREPPEEEERQADEYTDAIEAYLPANSPSNSYVNMATAVALVNRYCAKLPSDTFTRLTPLWSMKTIANHEQSLYVCTVRLPINSPVKQDIVGLPMPSKVLARRIAALEACRVLHQARELDDNLLPVGKESFRIHEEEDSNLALEELEEMVPRDSSEPRPGTTKRRQYYYKRIADALTDCRPIPGQPAYLYNVGMVLTCPLPEEQNTRGRRIYPPEDSPQGFGILTLKQIPKICPFPIFTRSGEVSVKLELSGSPVSLTEAKLEKIVTFLNYTFTSVLRLQKYLMMFDPQASENSYFIVPTKKSYKESPAEVDWEFLDRIYENRDLRPHPVPQEERVGFTFDASKYHDAVIMPWYRNQDQPQYFYVAEICSHLNPKSSFPGSEYKTFDEYYYKKYNIEIQNSKQPLLDVDHTSARLNFLTPRYVNRKGVALPTSSEETKRAKRENLEQKQILVPELCTVHPFPASLWRKAVCLPCVLYRINALLLADQIRRQVAASIALGQESLSDEFEWPPLDFGWSLADVLKKSKENAKNAENKDKALSKNNENGDKKDNMNMGAENAAEEDKQEEEDRMHRKKSANEILTEEEKKLRGDWMEIGTWSNDMADHHNYDFPEMDEFDPNVALPSNLTLLGEDAELVGLQVGGSDWGTGIRARRKDRVRYGSPSSWLGGGLEQDLEGFETDDSYSEPGNDYDRSDSSDLQSTAGLRIEFKSDNVAEAVEDEQETQKRDRRNAARQNSDTSVTDNESPWDWDSEEDIELDQLTMKYLKQFEEATKYNQHHIETCGILIKRDQPFSITRKINIISIQIQSLPIEAFNQRLETNHYVNGTQCLTQRQRASFIAGYRIIFKLTNCAVSEDTDTTNNCGLLDNYGSRHSKVETVISTQSDTSEPDEPDMEEDIISKFSFDAQPVLQGHPGPSPSVILQALTMSNANDGINLERLETIGDSFLKYAITTYLYCTYDNIHEGKLSHLRSKQVSNLNLYRLGRRKVFGESMIATKFEPHDNWLPPCYYVPRELEQALIEAGVPASHWNQADLPALRELSRDEICELVRERSEKLRATEEEMPVTTVPENLPCFIPYNLITQHSIPDKSVADCVEALIGAYLIACGPRGALLFMAWLGICVLPKEEMFLTSMPFSDDNQEHRSIGSLVAARSPKPGNNGASVWKQVHYGTLKAPRSPLLRNIPSPEVELNRLLDGYDVFEQRIRYRFHDRSYLLQSLTHASYSPNRLTDCYQRLEFLGDAVLDYLITRHLYEDSRQHSPGALTDLRSALVNNTIFASLAVRYGFHKYFRHLSPGLNEVVDRFVRIQEENGHTISEEYYLIEEEECEEAEDVEVPKALGDVFESVAGAIFLDSNMSLDAVWRVYYHMMKAEIEQFSTNVPKSPIRELLELEPETAKFGKPEKLADGRRVRVTVEVFGKGTFKGIGRNYRIAKCTAAKCALKQLKKKGLLVRKM